MGFFLRAGQVCLTQLWMASSSRSTARRAGFADSNPAHGASDQDGPRDNGYGIVARSTARRAGRSTGRWGIRPPALRATTRPPSDGSGTGTIWVDARTRAAPRSPGALLSVGRFPPPHAAPIDTDHPRYFHGGMTLSQQFDSSQTPSLEFRWTSGWAHDSLAKRILRITSYSRVGPVRSS